MRATKVARLQRELIEFNLALLSIFVLYYHLEQNESLQINIRLRVEKLASLIAPRIMPVGKPLDAFFAIHASVLGAQTYRCVRDALYLTSSTLCCSFLLVAKQIVEAKTGSMPIVDGASDFAAAEAASQAGELQGCKARIDIPTNFKDIVGP